MTTSDNIAAISKALEGGYWGANVYDCRPPRSRRDNPLKHSRIITVHGKFATEVEALSAGVDAIKNGWAGSCIIDRDSATHSATFELDRRAVSDLARSLPALLAEARKAEAMRQEIAEKDARIAALEAALMPFASHKTADGLPNGLLRIPDGHPVLFNGLGNDVRVVATIGDIRRARTLLNGGSDAQG